MNNCGMARHAVCLAALACIVATATPTIAGQAGERSAKPGEWTRISGGPETGCALGTPFSFYVRQASARKVMVFLQGGGACWNARTCDLIGEPTFDPRVDETDHPGRSDGVFNLSHPANPVRDYSMVFIPYCTGDVHLGTRDVTYTVPASKEAAQRSFSIKHRGASNVASALAWTTRHFPDPDIVFVTGTSAGAIPAPMYAAQLARRYGSARVLQLGDGAGGYRADMVPDVLARWGAIETIQRVLGGSKAEAARFNFESLYSLAARKAPGIRYAQYNNAEDEVQLFFLNLLGVADVPLTPLLEANLADMRRTVPWFRAYTSPGSAHTVLATPDFYTLEVDGYGIRDWVTGLLEGAAIPDIGTSLLAGRAE
jgi:hypothetical protein